METERDAGFTLIETLIAFMILSLALLIWTQTVGLAVKSINRAREDRLILGTLNCLDQNAVASQEGPPPEICREKGMRWALRKLRVSDAPDAPRFTIIEITAPSGRKVEFLRFGSVEPGQGE